MEQHIVVEMLCVMKPEGLILWEDYHVNNLWNLDVHNVPKQRLHSYFRAVLSPSFRHVQAGYAPALCAGHCLFSIAWSNHTELLKRMLIDTRDSFSFG